MKEQFRQLFRYAVTIASEKGYLDDEIELILYKNSEFTDDNGHVDWDRFWDTYDSMLKEFLGG